MVWKLQVDVISSASEETKLEVDTTSIILSYLYHSGNVNKGTYIISGMKIKNYLDTFNL